jgi:hypothetical protein
LCSFAFIGVHSRFKLFMKTITRSVLSPKFTNPDILAKIEPTRLLAWLADARAYLTRRGLTLDRTPGLGGDIPGTSNRPTVRMVRFRLAPGDAGSTAGANRQCGQTLPSRRADEHRQRPARPRPPTLAPRRPLLPPLKSHTYPLSHFAFSISHFAVSSPPLWTLGPWTSEALQPLAFILQPYL